ncbi:MAG: hypothetical protein II954_02120 [Synergistaceae bacterium]|nr:hypothetical protein [Synergistaceae bacterium]
MLYDFGNKKGWKSFKKSVKKVLPKPVTKAIISTRSTIRRKVLPTLRLKLRRVFTFFRRWPSLSMWT